MLKKRKMVSYLSLLPLTLLLACKKADTSPALPELRLFTNGIEIADAAIKMRFMAHASAAFQPLPTASPGRVIFVAADTAMFGTSTIRFAVVKNAAQYLFYSPQLVELTNNNILLYDMLKYVAPKVPVPSPGSLSGTYVTKEVRVGYRNAQQVQLSCLQYYWKQPYAQRSGLLFNEFNETVVAKVSSTDTLAVRTSRVSLVVQ